MIIREGENCWRYPGSDKASFIIDGADYFEAFADAAILAQKTIYISGWDIDSRLILHRRNHSPEIPPLGEFLNQLVKKKKSLHIYILTWDFSMLFMRERQWWPLFQLGWKTHRRVHFRMDDEQPLGGSQHEKIVVIDDRLAFCGGLDLTLNRWDTRFHHAVDSRRKDLETRVYTPFHDVQMVVAGDAAMNLGRLFRDHWQRATGQILSPPNVESMPIWPRNIIPDISSPVRVAISRTLPAYKGREAIREVEQLYVDAIRSARNQIYIENQYLTVNRICEELGNRLAEPDPPEVIIIMPQKASGWLEQSTMDAIRRYQLKRLYGLDHKKHMAVYYPMAEDRKTPVYIHSKLMIVDSRMAVVGSANLNNRSMGLDTECCLAMEGAPGSETEAAITRFRRRLLGEHLGISPEKLADREQAENRLISVIENLHLSGRSLIPLDGNAELVLDGTHWITDVTYLDPEEPFMVDRMVDHFAQESRYRQRAAAHILKIASILVILIGFTAIRQWMPLSVWPANDPIAGWMSRLDDQALLMPAVITAFMAGGLLFLPVTFIIGATALILPPIQSILCSFTGAVLNAGIGYFLGRRMGREIAQKYFHKNFNRLSRYFIRRDIPTMIMVRNLPIAPYTVINIICGALGLKFTDFLVGTAAGLLPGILIITIFVDRALEIIRNPGWKNILAAVAIVFLIGYGFRRLANRLKHRTGT